MQIEHGGLESVDHLAAHVEEAGAARRPQELAAGGGEQVAADALDVDGELSDRLAGVEQERHPRLPGEGAHLLGRVDQAAVGGHVGGRDEPHGLVPVLRLRRSSATG